jgi:hypothetical protein
MSSHLQRFAKSTCPVRTHTLSFVLNHLRRSLLRRITSFAAYSAPRVHQICALGNAASGSSCRGLVLPSPEDSYAFRLFHHRKLILCPSSLDLGPSAVNEQFDSRDETGIIRSEKQRHLRNFFRFPHTSHRNGRNNPPNQFCRLPTHERRIDGTRTHNV